MGRGRRKTARWLALLAVAACGDPEASTTETTAATTGDATSDATDTDATDTDETETTAGEVGWHATLKLDATQGALLSVWGPARDDVYAVGGQDMVGEAPSRGIAFHHDGVAWSEVSLPQDTPRLNWVHGVDGALWVVGQRGTALTRDGDGWIATETGTEQPLWGIWCAAADQLWAVGGDGVGGAPTLLRYDGVAWSTVAVPPLSVESAGLFKVWGVGQAAIVVGDLGATLIYDGASWRAEETGSLADLISVWGVASDDALAVGGRSNARLARWDGDAWSGVTLAEEPGLSGVWVDPGGEATVVGDQGLIARVAPGGLALVREESPTHLLLHAVTGFPDGTRVAVGGSLVGPPPFVGVAVHYTP